MRRQSSHHRRSSITIPAAAETAACAGTTRRRGSVIILVVGVLAVVAITAVTYVNIVSLDRKSAAAVSRRVNYQQQADAVMNHIRALIGADLFGEKIVTNSTPERLNDSVVWPSRFEEGDFSDMAFTNRTNPTFTGTLSTLNPQAPGERVSVRQDPWLASNEPLWLPNPGATDTWPQITNLRSGYTFDNQSGRWEHGDGKFVDLAQWFIDSTNGRGDPGADLSSFGTPADHYLLALDQPFFDRQMSALEPPNSVFNTRDERFMVDTDGDLRPDARWQQLEILGNNAGLIWVAAARVIDASALLNYNASIEFSYAATGLSPARISDGRTPADIDLFGLLDIADERAQNIAGNTRVRGDGTLAGFRQHLETSLQIENAIAQMTTVDTTYPDVPGLTTYMGWTPATNTLTVDQRSNWWRYVGSTPHEPRASKGAVHTTRDLIDLCAFWSTNHLPIFSSIEQDTDLLYPPIGTVGPNNPKGALRAAEDPSYWRSLDNGRPTRQDIKADTRRLLTPYNGSARFSPVPVLNSTEIATLNGQFNEFEGVYSMLKINPNEATAQDAPDIFASFMWALAPLATDEPLMRPFTVGDVNQASTAFNTEDFFYGGGNGGPAKTLVGTATGAAYVLRTSLALTANMLDNADGNGDPTVIRFFPRTGEAETPLQDSIAYTNGLDPYGATVAIELSDRFPHGDLRTALSAFPAHLGQQAAATDFSTLRQQNESLLDSYNGINNFPGAPAASAANDTMTAFKKGLTVVGLERQPFIREAFTAALYSDMADPLQPCDLGNADGVIDALESMGSLVAVQLANPWDEPITINEYEIVLPSSPMSITPVGAGDPEPLYFRLPSTTIPAGGDAVFFAVVVKAHPLNGDLADAIFDALPVDGPMLVVEPMTPWDPDIDDELTMFADAVMFKDIVTGNTGVSVPVVLRRLMTRWHDPASTAATPLFRENWAVVDILEPKAVSVPGDLTVNDRFPQGLADGEGIAVLEGTGATYGPLFMYADIQSENPLDSRLNGPGATRVAGRTILTSSVTRPGTQPAGPSFPAYCIEKQEFNLAASIDAAELLAAAYASPHKQWGWADPQNGPDDSAAQWTSLTPKIAVELVPAAWTDAGPVALSGVFSDLGEAAKYADSAAPNFPPFQLYCRDGNNAFPTVAAVAQLSTLAHFCVDHELDDLTKWKTVSQQLAESFDYGGSVLNPYMGTLDISRFVLNDTGTLMGAVANLPDAMAVPPALRVFDCFDTITPESDLVQGRINVNTAPIEVLAHLPFLWPTNLISDGMAMLPANGVFDEASMGSASPRASMLSRYRDKQFNVLSPGGDTPANLTGMAGLRVPGAAAMGFNTPGLASIGELAVMDTWTAGQPDATGTDLFQSLGIDTAAADGHPFDLTPTTTALFTPQGLTNQPADDIEEKLAIFRGMVNCASTRSDVFLAWFIVRGYDPDLIESIEITGTPENALNDERFVPTYESRWLCLFDRSNMVRPTDRPKLLMFVELPNAKP